MLMHNYYKYMLFYKSFKFEFALLHSHRVTPAIYCMLKCKWRPSGFIKPEGTKSIYLYMIML